MNTPESKPEFSPHVHAFIVGAYKRNLLLEFACALLRVLVTLAVLAGCTYLVFWRGESGWLFVPALILARFAR